MSTNETDPDAVTVARPRERFGSTPVERDDVKAQEVFSGLRALMDTLGRNHDRNERAIILAMACIGEGWNTRAQIVGASKKLGFDPKHVAIIVNRGTGPSPVRHRWWADADHRLHLHDDPMARAS